MLYWYLIIYMGLFLTAIARSDYWLMGKIEHVDDGISHSHELKSLSVSSEVWVSLSYDFAKNIVLGLLNLAL